MAMELTEIETDLVQLSRKHPGIFKLIAELFEFAKKTHEEQKPMVTRLTILKMNDDGKYPDYVSLWAGVGEDNPIQRIEALKAQTEELKRLLSHTRKGELSEGDKLLIDTVLKHFN